MEENEIYAIDKEIAQVQNKLNELKEKRKKYDIISLGEDYIGKYIRIRNLVDPHYIHECMFVSDIYPNQINPNLFDFVGKGFYYFFSDGDPHKIFCHIAELFNEKINKNDIENGDIQIDILTEDEYKEENRKMMEFIRKNYEY